MNAEEQSELDPVPVRESMIKVEERELLKIVGFFLEGAADHLVNLSNELESEPLRARLVWLSLQLSEHARVLRGGDA